MYPLIKTLNGKSGREGVNQMFNYHPPQHTEFIEVAECLCFHSGWGGGTLLSALVEMVIMTHSRRMETPSRMEGQIQSSCGLGWSWY